MPHLALTAPALAVAAFLALASTASAAPATRPAATPPAAEDFRLLDHRGRGRRMSMEARYPDGRTETLLSVPAYDFNWQGIYPLAEPKPLPAGTVIVCRGAFDNSPANPANPDPTKEVRFGEQSWDEMFIGYMVYSRARK